jgi:gluconate 2-dehydrogenase gamma chain
VTTRGQSAHADPFASKRQGDGQRNKLRRRTNFGRRIVSPAKYPASPWRFRAPSRTRANRFMLAPTNNTHGAPVPAGRVAMSDETIPRRKFLVGAGLAGTAVAAGLAQSDTAQAQAPGKAVKDAAKAAAAAAAPPAPAAAPPPQPEPLLYLNATEHAFVVAAVDTLIPADELSPSGSDCGCAVYVDRQLASAWGGGAKMYRGGPFLKGKPEQGYQLPLTPAQFVSAGIAAANAWTRKTYGKDFDRLDADKRVEAMKAMQEGKAEFERFSSRALFGRLHALTMEGFFGDPIYGGNRNMVSWKMLGFPGLPATYAHLIEQYRDKRYVAPAQSIADFS